MTDVKEKARTAIARARVQLLLEEPFFGVLALYLVPEEGLLPDYSAGIGTDGVRLVYQPKKILQMSETELKIAVAHEVLHLALLHLFRRENREPLKWNIATDYAVNAIIAKNYPLPEWALYSNEFINMCAEEIYDLLPGPECPTCGSKNIRGIKYRSTKTTDGSYEAEATFKCGHGHQWTEKYKITSGSHIGYPSMPFEEIEGDFPPVFDDHSLWDQATEQNPSAHKRSVKLAEEWKHRTIRAAQIARTQGYIPAGLERFIEDLLYPKLSWRQLLHQTVMRRGLKQCWHKPNKKYIRYGVYYPVKRHRRLEIAIAVDTSGSIDDLELRDFLSEVRGILATRPFKARLIACDAAIHTDLVAERLSDFDKFRVSIKGYGGTSFVPVFDALKDSKIQTLIYLTDGYGDYGEYSAHPPEYEVVWVLTKDGKEPPFGRVIRLG